jgi:cyclic dehypoxanthinyl futalosine synthase
VADNKAIRVSAVSFLNGRILYDSLLGERQPRDDDGNPLFEVRERLPSDCARDLAAGECDLALIPVASYIEHPEWEVVPGVGIGCFGPVETVVLVSRVPLAEIEEIALDGASRSSVLLLKVLLDGAGLSPAFETVPHGDGEGQVEGSRAALIIGDAAFGLRDRFEHVFDLGQMWFERTGLPFVFAFWAARPGVLRPEHVEALQWARDRSLGKFAESIARAYREELLEAGKAALSENHYANYLRRCIRYDLGTPQREGLVEFLAQARERKLIEFSGLAADDEVHIRFAGTAVPEVLRSARTRRAHDMNVDALLERAVTGGRIDLAEGIFLFERAGFHELGAAADEIRRRLHPEGRVTYIVDRNVNYTNLCVTRCKFCNFFVPPGHADGYVLSKDELAQKFHETEALGGVQILLQGGLNPDLGLNYYEDLFRWTKENFQLALHALSPTEIIHIAELERMSIRDVLIRLQAAGMDSVPGGGAEVLDDEIRNRISPFKNTTDEWLEVMRQAHGLGMRTTATMVFGFQETSEHLMLHLERLRSLQDETGGFTAFITWPFQAEGTRLKLRDDTSALRYLRIQALARLYLDNIPNIQVSWPTLGPSIGEVALRFGANDFGSVMIEENVVSQAGAHFMMSSEEIEAHIRWAGFEPARRNMRYELLTAAPEGSSRPPASPRSAREVPFS